MKGHFKFWFPALLLIVFVSGCGCGSKQGPAPVTLVSIEVTPANPSIALGTTQKFKATGVFSDNTTEDLTEAVTWSSSDTSVASVSNANGSQGLTSSLAVGTTTITATSGDISGTTTLTVTSAVLVSIEVTPANLSIALGTSQQFKATGVFSDNSTQDLTTTATWSSSDTSVASVSNADGSQGLSSSLAVGTTTITATSGDVSGTTTLTVTSAVMVSIEVTPANPSIALGTSQQFKATGVFSDNSTQDLTTTATWSASDSSVAYVSNIDGSQGLAKALKAGTITITASSGGLEGSTTLTVKPAELVSIDVTPADALVRFGTTVQYTATGHYADNTTQDITNLVTWSSSDTSIATISNAEGSKGLATTDHLRGTTVITATYGDISGSTQLVDP